MKLQEQIDLLQMKEITTKRQKENGTKIFQLPIKKHGQFIEVGSFKSGYVRRMNGCYTPYQLNKREKYSKYYKYNTDGFENPQTAYYKIDHYNRILIPIEIDRLEYLISYCLKNYYIKQANMIEDGKFVPKWKYENMKDRFESTAMELSELHVSVNGHKYKII